MEIKAIVLNQKTEGCCGYVGFDHCGKKYELYAKNSLQAIELLWSKVKHPKSKKFLFSVHVCEREDGTPILQSTCL